MKKQLIFSVLSLMLAAGSAGCDTKDYTNKAPFDNSVYIDAAAENSSVPLSFNRKVSERTNEISAVLAYPSSQEVAVSFGVDASLAAAYNSRHDTSYEVLDASYYSVAPTQTTIPAGLTASETVRVNFTGLDKLDIDKTYLVPVSITQATNVGILKGSQTVYYLVRRSSAITTAANLGADNYMEIPNFDTPEGGKWINGMKAVTYEAIINVEAFNLTASISTVMGVEQHCLLRLGDTGYTREQLQVEISGSNKFPNDDRNKRLKTGEWYHVAFTWNLANKEVHMYINGQLQSEGTAGFGGASIDLAMRAIFAADPSKYSADARQFFIGYSYDALRPLNGMISEVRIWNVARTQEQIWKNMYDVDPHSEGLCAYWKFDEGAGNVVKDQTGRGNDAISHVDLKWDNTIEIPQLNAE